MINHPCPSCTGEVPNPNMRSKPATCDNCYVATSDSWSEEAKIRNCGCYAVNHKKENLKGYKPLDESILKLIEVERATEKNQKAKDYFNDNLKKEIQTQLDYAEARPRDENNNVFDE